MVIQAIIDKRLPSVSRRPLHREREELIRLGNVFVFIEEISGIKRWTDGIPWSASRIIGRFLVYRQLDTFSVREKTYKRKNSRSLLLHPPNDIPGRKVLSRLRNPPADDHTLIKKTLSVSIEDANSKVQTIHLISYFSSHDVLSGNLIRPSCGGLDQSEILEQLIKSVSSLSLGGKMPTGDESQYFLDSTYQLLEMLAVSIMSSDIGPVAHYPTEQGETQFLQRALENINWSLPDTAQSLHFMQTNSQQTVNTQPLQPLLDYLPSHIYQHMHQQLPLQTPQDAYKIQMVPHMALQAPVTYPMHPQVSGNMAPDMHSYMQQMPTSHNAEDIHGSAYPISQPSADISSAVFSGYPQPTNVQQHQPAHGPSFYPWSMPQVQSMEYFPNEPNSERDTKEFY